MVNYGLSKKEKEKLVIIRTDINNQQLTEETKSDKSSQQEDTQQAQTQNNNQIETPLTWKDRKNK